MAYSIGELAKKADTGVETIRYYERRGLMPEPPRAANGYRRYPADAPARLRFIRRAKQLGFTLDDTAALLSLQAGGGERAEVKAIAVARLEDIETRQADLERMRAALEDVTRRCSGDGPVAGCPIVDTLSDEMQGA